MKSKFIESRPVLNGSGDSSETMSTPIVPAGPRGLHVLTPEDGIIKIHRGHVCRRIDVGEILNDSAWLQLLAVW